MKGLPGRWTAACARKSAGLLAAVLLTSAIASAGNAPGIYLFNRVAAPNLESINVVTFHPDGSYALAVEFTNRVHVLDWASRNVVTYDLTPPSGNIFWEDISFDAGGGFALIVGYAMDTASEGVLFRLDDAQLRSGGTTEDVFSEYPGAREAGRFTAIESPDAGLPVILSRDESNAIARLREFDAGLGTFGTLDATTASNGGCDDIAFVNNEVGNFGILVVCGTNVGQALYYTEVAGNSEWRVNPGNPSPGNIRVTSARSDGAYALIVSDSGRRLIRFEDGQMSDSAASPAFPTRAINHVAFAPGGERALVVGRAFGSPLTAPVLEYRHDLFAPEDVTDISITDFDSPPYLGTTNTFLFSSAWRPGCDGGLLAGGTLGGEGLLIEFTLDGGTSCLSEVIFANSFEGLL